MLDEQSGLQICFGSKDNSLCSNEELRLQKRLQKDLKSQRFQVFYGPSVEIRTQGLLNPIQARYQTSPHPDFLLSVAVSRRLVYNSTVGNGMQVFFSLFSFFQNFFPATPFPTPSVRTALLSRCSPLADLAKNLILLSVLFSILSKRFFFLKCYKLFTISEKTFFFYFQPFHFPTVLRSDGRNFEGILLRSDNGQKEVAYL